MSKKILYSLGVGAMLIGMASCSNDNVDGPNIITPDKAVGYAKVSINFPKADGTRAAENFNGYENGIATEQAIEVIHLALYDEDGNFVGTGEQVNEGAYLAGKDNTGNVEKIYSDVFKLYLDEGSKEPVKVIAFVNTDIKSGTLQELEAGYPIEVSKEIVSKEDAFPMTNSGYYAADGSDANWTVAVPFTYDDTTIFDSAEEAKANADSNDATPAATIYVERLAAKVNVKLNENGVNQDNLNYVVKDVDGKELKLTFNASDWTLTGVATKENVVKSKFNTANLFSDYNKASDLRSFWAEGAFYANDDLGFYYDKSKKTTAETNPLTYLKFADLKAEGASKGDNKFDISQLTDLGTAEYAPEHTTILKSEEATLLANTYAIVVGKYSLTGEHAEWFQSSDEPLTNNFYLLLSGMDGDKKVYTAYTKSQLIAYLLNMNGVTTLYTQSGKQLDTKVGAPKYDPLFDYSKSYDIDYNAEAGKYVLAELAGSTQPLYDAASEGNVVAYNPNWTKTTNSRHYYFPEGGAYFNVPLKHAVEGTNVFYGLVRNHSYKLTINEIQNLGAPLDENGHDENDPIVPDIDELKEHFINAQIEILSWHVVENGVIL